MTSFTSFCIIVFRNNISPCHNFLVLSFFFLFFLKLYFYAADSTFVSLRPPLLNLVYRILIFLSGVNECITFTVFHYTINLPVIPAATVAVNNASCTVNTVIHAVRAYF